MCDYRYQVIHGISLCGARIDIECAFGRLQGWSSALLQPLEINLAELAIVIYACFVQYNFCEINKESL